jgi:Flp pilus assembly pilin Flp
LVTSKTPQLASQFGALLTDERAAVAPEYALVMAVCTIPALGGMYAFRTAVSAMLTFQQASLYNYGHDAP